MKKRSRRAKPPASASTPRCVALVANARRRNEKTPEPCSAPNKDILLEDTAFYRSADYVTSTPADATGFVLYSNNDAVASAGGRSITRPSVPFVCIVWHCTIALRPNHAEPVPGWRLHNPPGFYPFDSFHSKCLQAHYFRLDVVALDIEVNAAWRAAPSVTAQSKALRCRCRRAHIFRWPDRRIDPL